MDDEKYFVKNLERFAADNQEYGPKIADFMKLTLDMSAEKQKILIQAFLRGNTALRTAFWEFMKKGRGRVFWAYKEYPPNIANRLFQAASNEQLRSWEDTVRSVPQKTAPIYAITGAQIKKAMQVLIGNACLKAVEQETPVRISQSDIAFAADNMMNGGNKTAVIGFR